MEMGEFENGTLFLRRSLFGRRAFVPCDEGLKVPSEEDGTEEEKDFPVPLRPLRRGERSEPKLQAFIFCF